MREVLEALVGWMRAGKRVATATAVATEAVRARSRASEEFVR
jgi:hypothetical protein